MNIVCNIDSSHDSESYDEEEKIEAGSVWGRFLFCAKYPTRTGLCSQHVTMLLL